MHGANMKTEINKLQKLQFLIDSDSVWLNYNLLGYC